MHTLLRLLLVMLMAAGTSSPLVAATTSSKGKKSSQSETSSKKKATTQSDSTPGKAENTPAKKTTPPPSEPVNEDPPTPVPTPAAVSTLSIEDISGFDDYPKQIQSLVQSCLALTHLELGYLYGSHEPSKGGMDCSGTIYHVLHFQGLKDVPRQSDEMCNWVDKKGHLYLTPTATSFDSEEFANLKPGDLLFWTSTTEKTRKLPVTHVMVYLGKLKKTGKRIVFGSSDGRSYMGERRSGVSVFDFSLPRPESTKHFYGYGPTPGLLPVEPERPVIAAVAPAAPAPKESAVSKETPAPKETAAVKETTAAKESPAPKVAASATKKTSVTKDSAAAEESSTPKEEVRKAVAVPTETPSESTSKKTVVAETKSAASTKAVTSSKPKTSATQKRSTSSASTTRRRTPAAPPKSVFEQKVDRAVVSVRRFFQR